MRIQQVITERFENLIGDDPKKDKYKQQVYDLLQTSYAAIGGFKGSGAESPDAMKSAMPFWKVATKDGKVVAVALYKDKNGRKTVASGTDGTPAGKEAITSIMKADPERSYAEKSKASLGLYMKSKENPVEHLMTPEQVKKITGKDVTPVASMPNEESWPVSDKERASTATTLAKYPALKDYGYFRNVNGEMLFKVMSGTPNLPVK